jgi:AAA15 family ATPase/GTPase
MRRFTMLLEFRAKNYKSFRGEMVFSMDPSPIKDLSYSVLRESIGSKKYSSLCSSVLIGANASGKSNAIGAMHAFKSIVLRGNIRNSGVSKSNEASCLLELIPNCFSSVNEPISFHIRFIEKGVMIEYGFKADVGGFMQTRHPRKILSEELKINGKMVFLRENQLEIGFLQSIESFLISGFYQNKDWVVRTARFNLNDEELFLMNDFKSMFSNKLVSLISNWLSTKFMVVCRSDANIVNNEYSISSIEVERFEETLKNATDLFGLNSSKLVFSLPDGETGANLISSYRKDNKETCLIDAERFESSGTIHFLSLLPMVIDAIRGGHTLVFDEFDAFLHPTSIISFVSIFHNDDINKNHAQLIFNTHNAIFLNARLFRRDEIKFVERDVKTHSSRLFSLSDFGFSGKFGVSKSEDIMKNYYFGRYGAINLINYSPFFERLMEGE